MDATSTDGGLSSLPLSDQYPVIPDERDMMSRGARVTREIERSDCLSRQNVLVLRCLLWVLNRYANEDIDVFHVIATELPRLEDNGRRNITVKNDGNGGAYLTREA